MMHLELRAPNVMRRDDFWGIAAEAQDAYGLKEMTAENVDLSETGEYVSIKGSFAAILSTLGLLVRKKVITRTVARNALLEEWKHARRVGKTAAVPAARDSQRVPRVPRRQRPRRHS